MRYMFLIYSRETGEALAPEERSNLMKAHWSVMDEAAQKGVLVGVDALKPTPEATTVRMNKGNTIMTDGPFAETKEQLAGYYILDCESLDEAIAWYQGANYLFKNGGYKMTK